MYKFDFWKFRGDVIQDHSYVDLAALFEQGQSTIGSKLAGKSELKIGEFIHWCNCLKLDPINYIDVEAG